MRCRCRSASPFSSCGASRRANPVGAKRIRDRCRAVGSRCSRRRRGRHRDCRRRGRGRRGRRGRRGHERDLDWLDQAQAHVPGRSPRHAPSSARLAPGAPMGRSLPAAARALPPTARLTRAASAGPRPTGAACEAPSPRSWVRVRQFAPRRPGRGAGQARRRLRRRAQLHIAVAEVEDVLDVAAGVRDLADADDQRLIARVGPPSRQSSPR